MTPLSLGEAEALARKAARGAGLDWGTAEEAGRAVRWLCAHQLPGGEALAGLLMASDGVPPQRRAPVCGAVWRARAGCLCPVTAGATLADRAGAGPQAVTLADLAWPLLLLPFAQAAAARHGATLRVAWPGFRADVAAGALALGPAEAGEAARAAEVTCRPVPGPQGEGRPRGYRAALRPGARAALERFAARTYAPATQAGRLAGAGAGLTDND